jgi:hypothetical protein
VGFPDKVGIARFAVNQLVTFSDNVGTNMALISFAVHHRPSDPLFRPHLQRHLRRTRTIGNSRFSNHQLERGFRDDDRLDHRSPAEDLRLPQSGAPRGVLLDHRSSRNVFLSQLHPLYRRLRSRRLYAAPFAMISIKSSLSALGMGMCESAYTLALNMYFKNKRSVAMGLAVTVTGFGPILIPQLIRLLMQFYTAEGVTLIFGGICAHVFIAATLLQPVKWHMKVDETVPPPEEQVDLLDKPKDEEVEDSTLTRFYKSVAKTFDLDLLQDPVFVNIMMGMALAIFAELNFTVLTPFILSDFGLDTGQIATFLSTLGVADIIFRFFAPHIGNYFTKPPRLMYAYSLCLLIVTRFSK